MYTLEAILGRYTMLAGALAEFPSATLIRLAQDIGMIPIDGFLLRELEIYYQGGTKVTHPEYQQFSPALHPDFERLIVGVEKLAQHLSHRGMVAYYEATFTGGYGGHATMIWHKGKRIGDPGNNINDFLRLLEVVPQSGLDEFDTLGLGRHRSTKGWLSNSPS
jgi:hypothetical protein